MAKKKTATKPNKEVSFEKSLADLEQVMGDLERGELSLDDSLKKYEAGMQHLRSCYSALKNAEKKIQVLVDIDDSGNARLENFDHGATVAESQSSDAERESDSEVDEDDFSDEDPNEGSLF